MTLLSEFEAEMSVLDPDDWHNRAVCRQVDPELWFPEKGGSTHNAKKICHTCPVEMECLEHALLNNERFGIWGGMSERERRKIPRRKVYVAIRAIERSRSML